MWVLKSNHRKGFSLIEVLVATVIISLVGVGIMNVSLQHTDMDRYITDKASLTGFTSIIAFHHNEDFDKLEKPLYDFIEEDYEIKHDELRRYLQNTMVRYTEDSVNQFMMDTSAFGTDSTEDNALVQDPEAMQDQLPEIEIRKATIELDKKKGHVYFLYQTEQSTTEKSGAF